MLRSLLKYLTVATVASVVSGLTIHMVPHTHDDVGWLKTVDQYYYGLHDNDIQNAAVQYIIKSVIDALSRNPDRKFMYVEQAFFQRFWREANDYDKDRVRKLVKSGQLEFVNGGWCMHDEAAAHFVDMIDQTTLGHKFIVEEFGQSAVPTIGWQIDPFGHSATQASLLSAEMGFDGLYFGRIDYQDHNNRVANKNLEFIWRASQSQGADAQVFSGAFQSGNYGPPGGFCFDAFDCGDLPVQSNPDAPDYNLDQRVADAIKAAMQQAAGTAGDLETMNIMWTLGSDFQHMLSEAWMTNLDKLIDGINKMSNGTVKAMYSTPSIYTKAKNAEKVTWSVKTDDFFPYADGADNYWTGYFTSRPALKRYIRVQSAFLQVARHMELFSGSFGNATERLWEAQSVAQHHDAVSGTAKQAVTFDYAQRLSKGYAVADEMVQQALGSFVTQSGDAPYFQSCPLANVSSCPATQNNKNVVVALYNPIARRATKGVISIPVNSQSAVIVDAAGKTVQSQVVPVAPNAAIQDGSAGYRAFFTPTIAGLGINTYFIQSASEDNKVTEVVEKVQKRDSRRRHHRALKSVEITNLESDRLSVGFDANTGLINSVTDKLLGKTYPFAQDFAWYEGYAGNGQDSGAYIFRPAVLIGNNPYHDGVKITNLVNGPIVSEAWQQVSPYISQIIRLRAGSVGIEFEYTVGPIDVSDNKGKEIIMRFNSTIASNATWYTDSNGREFQTRIRDYRPTWKLDVTQPAAGNYYPINAAAYLKDGDNAMVILNDRSQGCSSLVDGSMEVMVHRRLLKDDGRGVGEPLNEPGLDGKGLIITGTLVVAIVPQASANAVARMGQAPFYNPYHVSYAALNGSVSDYASSHTTALSFLQTDLPLNVELLTLQFWDQDTVLIRLAHSFGVGEDSSYSKPVTVDLNTLFSNPFSNIAEYSLSAALPAGSHQKMHWNTADNVMPSGVRTALDGSKVTLNPMEIKTFLCTM